MGKSLQKEVNIVATLKGRIFWTYVVLSGLPSKISVGDKTGNLPLIFLDSYWFLLGNGFSSFLLCLVVPKMKRWWPWSFPEFDWYLWIPLMCYFYVWFHKKIVGTTNNNMSMDVCRAGQCISKNPSHTLYLCSWIIIFCSNEGNVRAKHESTFGLSWCQLSFKIPK